MDKKFRNCLESCQKDYVKKYQFYTFPKKVMGFDIWKILYLQNFEQKLQNNFEQKCSCSIQMDKKFRKCLESWKKAFEFVIKIRANKSLLAGFFPLYPWFSLTDALGLKRKPTGSLVLLVTVPESSPISEFSTKLLCCSDCDEIFTHFFSWF